MVTVLNFMILEVMLKFNVYVLANIKLCVGCDNLTLPKTGQRSFYNTFQNTQIFNPHILVADCPNSITPYFVFLPQKHYSQMQRAQILEYFQNVFLHCGYLCGLHPILSYEVKQNTSGPTQFIGRYSNNLQILELRGQLFLMC